MSRVLICGHTGVTGSFLLDYLMSADWVDSIVTIGRRKSEKYSDAKKVKQIIVEDMTNLGNLNMDEIGEIDVAYDLIATKVSEAFNGAEFYRIADVTMATEFAKLAKKAGAEFIGAICQQGADKDKDFGKDYSRQAKHDFMENVKQMGFSRVAFLMPAWVARQQGNSIGEFIYTFGGLKGVKASAMAKCLMSAALNQKERLKLYSEKEIKRSERR